MKYSKVVDYFNSEDRQDDIAMHVAASCILLNESVPTTFAMSLSESKFFLGSVFDSLCDQGDLCVASLRALAALMLCVPNGKLVASIATNTEFLGTLVGVAKCMDDLLIDPLAVVLQVLCLSDSNALLSATLGAHFPKESVHIVVRFSGKAFLRQTSLRLISCLMITREGCRALQGQSEDVALIVSGTDLSREWRLVRHM